LAWMFAALNTVEPPIQFLIQLDLLGKDAQSAQPVRAAVLERIGKRLTAWAIASDKTTTWSVVALAQRTY